MELTESRVRELSREEMNKTFGELANDVGEIKRALLGSERYGDSGMINDVKKATEYIERATQHDVFNRGMAAIKWFEYMGTSEGADPSKLKLIEEIISFYKVNKFIVALFAGGTLVNIIVAIKVVLDLLK